MHVLITKIPRKKIIWTRVKISMMNKNKIIQNLLKVMKV